VLDVRVDGGQKLATLGKALRGADRAYRKQLRGRLRDAVKPLGQDVKQQMPTYLPRRYAQVLQRAFRPRIKIRTGGLAAVRVIAVAKGKGRPREVKAIDGGTLRHPVFGNRRLWVAQRVRAGFWSDPMQAGAPKVRRQVVEIINDVHAQIAKGGLG
jgi:hypothetical protein